MKIFIVLGRSGYPEDSYDWVDGWTGTKEAAEAHAEACRVRDEAAKPYRMRSYGERTHYEVMEAEELP